MNGWRKLVFPILLYCFLATLISQQYFVDELAARTPQILDRTIGAWFVDVTGNRNMDLVVENVYSTSNLSYILINNGIGHFVEDSLRTLYR